jgi:hypothetical protein
MTARYVTARAVADASAKLGPRDEAIVRDLAQLRFMSGDQLARLHFADTAEPEARARAARRALLRLTRLGCLVRLPRPIGGVRAGSQGFVYALGALGQRLASERGWQPWRRPRRSQTPGSLFLAHTLQISELHTRLREADRAGRLELLELTAEPACWRVMSSGNGSSGSTALKPDSFLGLGAGEFEFSYFIEVDRGTEGSRTVGRKLGNYLRYHQSGREQADRGVFPKTHWLAPDAARVAMIADCIRRLPEHHRALFSAGKFDDVLTTLSEEQATHT